MYWERIAPDHGFAQIFKNEETQEILIIGRKPSSASEVSQVVGMSLSNEEDAVIIPVSLLENLKL